MAFARIGVFKIEGEQVAEIIALFRDRVTPMFAAHEGFLGYQAFVDQSARRYIGISYWCSLAALEASATAALRAREEAAALGARALYEPMITREEFDTRESDK